MTDVLGWASIAALVLAGWAAASQAQAQPADSLQIEVHAASAEFVDGWHRLDAAPPRPAGQPDSLWISPASVALAPADWQRLAFRVENGRPVLTVVPSPAQQDALRTLLREAAGAHLVIQLNGTVRYATQILSIEGTVRSLKLMHLSPEEAARIAQAWQAAR